MTPAYVEWGGKWRTPSEADFIELLNECDYEKILGKRNGLKFTAQNGNTLFFPSTDYYKGGWSHYLVCYWSRNLKKSGIEEHLKLYECPIVMFFGDKSGVDWFANESSQLLGLPVRPVFNNN